LQRQKINARQKVKISSFIQMKQKRKFCTFSLNLEINQNKQPIYGAYVIGKFWNFIVLENKTYSLSKTFDCTEHDDLLKIIAVLRKFNQLIMSI
jgi:hypothetical protein